MSLKKPRGRTSFCRRIYHMCQPFLYDMSPSSSKSRPSPFPLTLLSLRNGDGGGMWMKSSFHWKLDICDECDVTKPPLILACVANSLQERRFAGIGPSDYKDTKVSIFCSEVIGITVGYHDRCGSIYELLVKCYYCRGQASEILFEPFSFQYHEVDSYPAGEWGKGWRTSNTTLVEFRLARSIAPPIDCPYRIFKNSRV